MMLAKRAMNVISAIVLIFSIFEFEVSGQGLTCENPLDISQDVPEIGAVYIDENWYSFDVDVSAGSQYYSFTAPSDGDFKLQTGTGTAFAKIKVYNDQCILLDEAGYSAGMTYFVLEFSADDTYIFEWNGEDIPADMGFEQFTSLAMFQSKQPGKTVSDAIEIEAGVNSISRLHTDQFFTFEVDSDAEVTVSTCLSGSYVTETNLTLYKDDENNQVADNVACYDNEETQSLISYSASSGDVLILKADHIKDYNDFYNFELEIVSVGSSCETPLDIAIGIHDVDNSQGDQWFSFVAPKSGDAVITTGNGSLAGVSYLYAGEDTRIELHDACADGLLDSDDGAFGVSQINYTMVEGVEYFIMMDDVMTDGLYEFEVFYSEDLIIGTEEAPLPVVIGLNEEYGNLHFTTEQWFEYEFLTDGLFTMQFNTIYNSSPTSISTDAAVSYTYPDEDSAADGFTIEGTTGEKVLFSISGQIRNNTFNASLETGAETGEDCYTPIDLTADILTNGGTVSSVELNELTPNRYYTFTPDEAGTFLLSICDPSNFILADLKIFNGPCVNEDVLFEKSIFPATSCGIHEYPIALEANQTINIEWQGDIFEGELVEENFSVITNFEPHVAGEDCGDAIPMIEGENTVTRKLGEQYFTFTAQNEGVLEIATCTDVSGVQNTDLALYSGCGDLVTPIWDDESCPDNAELSTMRYLASTGETVILRVRDIHDWNEEYAFSMAFDKPDCENYTDVSTGTHTVNNYDGYSFLRFQATSDGEALVSTCRSGVDTRFRRYSAFCGDLLQENDNAEHCDDGGSKLTFSISAGDFYYLEVKGAELTDEFDVDILIKEENAGYTPGYPIIINNEQTTIFNTHGEYLYASARVMADSDIEVGVFSNDGGGWLDILDHEGEPVPNEEDFTFLYSEIDSTFMLQLPQQNPLEVVVDLVPMQGGLIVQGSSCDYPIDISEPGIYSVAHTDFEDNDQWYKLTAPKSGSIVVTTGPSSRADGIMLSVNEETSIEIYDDCLFDNDPIANNDDHPDMPSGASLVNLDVVQGEDYYILMIDEFINEDYQFELFYEEDLLVGTEEAPLEVVIGSNAEFGHIAYAKEQWFKYEFSAPSSIDLRFDTYFDGIATEVTTANEILEYYLDEDDPYPSGFTYAATIGNELIFNLSEFNSTFSFSFVEDLCKGEYTQIEEDHWSEWITVEGNTENQIYRFTAPRDGDLLVMNEDNDLGIDFSIGLAELCDEVLVETERAPLTRMITSVKQGVTYELLWELSDYDEELDEPIELDEYEFDYYFGYLDEIPGQSQEDAIVIETENGFYDAATHLIDEQWFVYMLAEDGTVIVEKFMEAIETDATIRLTSTNSGYIDHIDDESASYTGLAGDEIFVVWNNNDEYIATNFRTIFEANLPCEDTNIVEETACDLYEFGEEDLLESGQYLGDFVNEAGCDSLVVLNLTILERTNGSEAVETCDSYDWEGTTYTSSGEYYETLTNDAGCDSLATLSLTILGTSDEMEEEVTACDYYEFDGETLTSSGEYTATFTNQSGCDSLVNLSLLIHISDEESVEVSACDSFEFDGSFLTSTGEYTATFTNQVGCDSLVSLNLTILEGETNTVEEEACGSYTFDDNEYFESGDYQATFSNTNGCDSLVNLALTILEEPSNEITINGVILFAEDKGDVTFQWYDCDTGEELEGETKRQLTPKQAGFYAVEVANENCTVISVCMNSDGLIMSVEESEVRISAYPNPTTSHVQLDLGHFHENIEVEVLSIAGNIVQYISDPYTNKIAVDLSEKKGVYFFRVLANQQYLQTIRVIKE